MAIKGDGRTMQPEYRHWIKMKSRCNAKSGPYYKNWASRGIKVCEEWTNDFWAFRNHIGPKPSPKHSVDRIDNDKGYEPGNVRWATQSEQLKNRRPITQETKDKIAESVRQNWANDLRNRTWKWSR